jgi:hypothetical protein
MSRRTPSKSSIVVSGATSFVDPAHLKLFLDGIALAEGKSPADGPAEAQS